MCVHNGLQFVIYMYVHTMIYSGRPMCAQYDLHYGLLYHQISSGTRAWCQARWRNGCKCLNVFGKL